MVTVEKTEFSEEGEPTLLNRLKSFLSLKGADSNALKHWFNQFVKDLESRRNELIESLEEFSKELSTENSQVRKDFSAQLEKRVEDFNKSFEAELQHKRIELEKEFESFMEAIRAEKERLAQDFLNRLRSDGESLKDTFITEFEREGSTLVSELTMAYKQRLSKASEELENLVKALNEKRSAFKLNFESEISLKMTNLFNEALKELEALKDEKLKHFKDSMSGRLLEVQSFFEKESKGLSKTCEEAVKKAKDEFALKASGFEKTIDERLSIAKNEVLNELASRKEELNKHVFEALSGVRAELDAGCELAKKSLTAWLKSMVEDTRKNLEQRMLAIVNELEGELAILAELKGKVMKLKEKYGSDVKGIETELEQKVSAILKVTEEEIASAKQKFMTAFEKKLIETADATIASSSGTLSKRLEQAQRVVMHEFDRLDNDIRSRIDLLRQRLNDVASNAQKQIDAIEEKIKSEVGLRAKALEWNLSLATKTGMKNLSGLGQFRFVKDGDWIKVFQRGLSEPTMVFVAGGQLYCGSCSENPCIHVKAVKGWLEAQSEGV